MSNVKRKVKRKQSIDMVKVIIGPKVWEMNTLGALSIINMAKEKFEHDGKHAIVAVKKGKIYSLVKETFNTRDDLIRSAKDWTEGGYSPFYTHTVEEESKDGKQ